MNPNEQRVAVVIPAKDEEARIGATIRAARAIPHVDLVIVVDDGSEDNTKDAARAAGATVIRHSVNRGKASAMETGGKVALMRDAADQPARLLLFLDADLGDTAVEAAPLIEPVLRGDADFTIAALPPQEGAAGFGLVTGAAYKAIKKATGWSPRQPISGQRCLTREAFEAARPLATGWGVETGMTIDLLVKGFTVQEVVCDIKHRATGKDFASQMHRFQQLRGVKQAIWARSVRRVRVPKSQMNTVSEPYQPYKAYKG